MTGRRAIWEVARRELVERSRSRVLRISVVLLAILAVGGAIAAARLGGGTPTDDIGLVGARSVALEPAIALQARAADRRARLHRLPSVAAARGAVRSGTVEVALLDGVRILVKTSGSQPAVRVVRDAIASQTVVQRLRSTGLSEPEALALLTPKPVPVDVLEANTRNTDQNQMMIFIGLMALFIVLAFFGQAVAQGVTEEKSSRVIELLLTAIAPRRLLAGKVLGIGLLGLLVLLWFVLGYVFYSVAFAAVGALVSRQEDLQTAMLPVSAVMMGAFYLALIASGSPNGTVAQVGAFVPPFAPMVVPMRMVLGDMSALALVAAVATDVVATVGLVFLAGGIYERAILRIGAPVKLRRMLSDRRRARPEDAGAAGARRPAWLDLTLRIGSAALLVAGVAIGFDHTIAIVLVVLGLLVLLGAVRARGVGPRRFIH